MREAAAPSSLSEYLDKTFARGNRGQNPKARAPETPEEYLSKVRTSSAQASMLVGHVEGLGLGPDAFLGNVPAWLGPAPDLPEPEYQRRCTVLVIGGGPAGTTAALKLASGGVDVLCLEAQTWEEYDAYACDICAYNSKFFLDLGVPEYDPMEIYNEYMRKALGHAHPKLVRDYVTRSGEMLDWVLSYLPRAYVRTYAHPTHYKGNPYYSGETCGQKSFIGMLQWRDEETNNNMWPFMMRNLHDTIRSLGGSFLYGAQAVRLTQDEDGTVLGCIARDLDNRFFKVHCQAVLAAAGDYGGNPDMLLDLSDSLRNLAWSVGLDRTSPDRVTSGGRDGSGIRMCLWAGGTMESGPRAGQSATFTEIPKFPFGGCWPTFGPEGRRFMNETLVKFGTNPALDMLPPGSMVAIVTDAHWDEYCQHQGYGHECMDRSNDGMLAQVRSQMAAYQVGPEGFPVRDFAKYGSEFMRIWAADTLEELGVYLGYTGDALQAFLQEVQHWNDLCVAGYDSDWGCDPEYMFPILTPPFFGYVTHTGTLPDGGLCQNAGVCTDGDYRVLNARKQPIPGLYAAGNTCGQRYGVQYHTPTAGNCCGSAMTSGYVAAECILKALETKPLRDPADP